MATRKKSLASSMMKAAGKSPVEEEVTATIEPELVVTLDKKVSKEPKSRKGTRLIGGHFPPEVHKQLKLIAVNEDKTVQELLGESLNLLFAEYEKPPIA